MTLPLSLDLAHKGKDFADRRHTSGKDFWIGVRPLIENQSKGKILRLETLQDNELIKAFDHIGIDAFYLDRQNNLKGLASRVNYTRFEHEPAFTLRYALWDKKIKDWNYNREYQRKLYAVKNKAESNFFPHLHVESFSQKKGEGIIAWSYMAQTEDIVRYIEEYLGDKSKVDTFPPRGGEKRLVVYVPLNQFAKTCKLHAVKTITDLT